MPETFITQAFKEARSQVDIFLENPQNLAMMEKCIDEMVSTINNGGRLLSCGNGGSMCDSMHFVEELTGRFRKDRPPISAMSMGDPSHITCVANDYGYKHIFERHVEAWGRSKDVLLAISTSGNSENVILAAQKAKSIGMKVIGLLGKEGGKLSEIVDYPLIIQNGISDRIQEMHIKIIHIFIEGIERRLYPQHY